MDSNDDCFELYKMENVSILSIYINEYWVKLFAVWAKFFLLAANRELSINGRRYVL